MTKDEAVTRARAEQTRTGYPQLISMASDGSWSHRSLDGTEHRRINVNDRDDVTSVDYFKRLNEFFDEQDALASEHDA